MNKKSIMKSKKVNRDTLTVTQLVKVFNFMSVRDGRHVSSQCTCILNMYNDIVDFSENCPLHIFNTENDTTVALLLQNFKEKNFLYVSTSHYENIIYHRRIQMTLPLIINLEIKNGLIFFLDRTTPLKLNNRLVKYTNLLILNFIETKKSYIKNFNDLLITDKVLKVKYILLVNSLDKRIRNFIEKDFANNCFILHLKKFIDSKNTY